LSGCTIAASQEGLSSVSKYIEQMAEKIPNKWEILEETGSNSAVEI
jgi:hypothetical protein